MKQIDFDILKKFGTVGPRYTSYPTAPLFSADFTDVDLENEIIATNLDPLAGDISLYFHFPYCAKLCYFCGCNMKVTKDRKKIADYNDYLKREVLRVRPLIGVQRKVEQMHWGGGTPSYLTPEEIRDIGDIIKTQFEFTDDAEISVEIDPRGLEREHLETFREAGFNRTSFGVQDFDHRVQEAINRIQPEEMTRQTVAWTRELGFGSLNLDLIYGLPFQTPASFADTVKKVIEISPDRIAVFNYAHVPWLKKHQNIMPADEMPDADERLNILRETTEMLTSAGYEYIGMDHFAKPTDELAIAQKNNTLYRNFQGYSTKAGLDVYAFGVSSISQFSGVYAQNVKSLPEYFERVDAGRIATNVGYRLTDDDKLRREVISQIMCHLEIDKRKIERDFAIDFDRYFADDLPKLDKFIEQDLVEVSADKITLVGSGILVIRNIAMCFDAHLEKMMKEKPVFSKTV